VLCRQIAKYLNFKLTLHVVTTSLEKFERIFNPLNAELNPIYHLLALLGAHPILHISRVRVKVVTVLLVS